MPEHHDDDELLEEWANEVCAALELEGLTVDVKKVLGLAGRAAHTVARPAAPLTTFITGYAAGRAAAGGRDADAAVADAIAVVMKQVRERATE